MRRNLETRERYKKLALQHVDLLFEDSISAYSESIQKHLKQMYFEGTSVTDMSGLLERGIAGSAKPFLSGTDMFVRVEIDERLRDLPLTRKMTLILEIAGHAGAPYCLFFIKYDPILSAHFYRCISKVRL